MVRLKSDQDGSFEGLKTRTLGEILSGTSQQVSWLVADLIPQPAFTVVYGAPKSGKTTLLAHLVASVTLGKPFLERETLQGPVLWLDLEQDSYLTATTLREAGAPDDVHIFNGLRPHMPKVLTAVERIRPVVVVVDSLSRLLNLQYENDASEMNRKLLPLLSVCRELRSSVLAVHHDRKREGSDGRNMRGSGALLAAVDLALEVRKSAEDANKRHLRFTSRYSGIPDKLGIKLDDEGRGYQICDGEPYVKAADLLKLFGPEPMTVTEWAKQANISRQAMSKRIYSLLQEGHLKQLGTGTKGDPFRYLPTIPDAATVSKS